MIRLIASDVDGTIRQRGQSAIPQRYFSLIQELYRKEILFALATGRSYGDCRRLFAPVAGKIAYVASDGAAVFCGSRLIEAFPLRRDNALSLAMDGFREKGTEVLLVGRYASYCRPKTAAFAARLRESLHGHLRVVESYGQVQEPILKVSFYTPGDDGAQRRMALFDKFASRWQGMAQIAYAANGWLELVAPGVDKGKGLQCLLDYLRMTPDQCEAFGDNYNDRALLATAGKSFAMESAPEEIRALATGTCKDVEQEIRLLCRER